MTETAPVTRRFSVLVADDDVLVREALGGLIEDHPELTLAGSADCGTGAAEFCARRHPDLAVLDVMMPAGGSEAVSAIRAVSPRTVVVAYTARSDRRTRERLLASGAAAVFVKGTETDLAGALYGILTTGGDATRRA